MMDVLTVIEPPFPHLAIAGICSQEDRDCGEEYGRRDRVTVGGIEIINISPIARQSAKLLILGVTNTRGVEGWGFDH